MITQRLVGYHRTQAEISWKHAQEIANAQEPGHEVMVGILLKAVLLNLRQSVGIDEETFQRLMQDASKNGQNNGQVHTNGKP